MDNFLQSLGNLLSGGQPKIISPLPQKGPQFQDGKTAIQKNPPVYIKKMYPGEDKWIHEQMQNDPNTDAVSLAKTYYDASTAPGGINYQPTATPTPTPMPSPNTNMAIPTKLATIPDDPGTDYNSIIQKASQQFGIPAPLLKGVLAHESMQFNPKYVGGYHTDGTGRGVAAIDKNAHPEITDDQAFDPSFAIPWAAKTLSGYKTQEGNWINALRRYNGGGNYAANVPGYAGVPVYQRTQDYANNVLKQAHHFAINGASSTPYTSDTP